jgi:hypothetical protein
MNFKEFEFTVRRYSQVSEAEAPPRVLSLIFKSIDNFTEKVAPGKLINVSYKLEGLSMHLLRIWVSNEG